MRTVVSMLLARLLCSWLGCSRLAGRRRSDRTIALSPRSACRRGSSNWCLPGSELEAKPIEDRAHAVGRPDRCGSIPTERRFRYDIVYYGLEPGEYDLKDYLRRKDGSSLKDLRRSRSRSSRYCRRVRSSRIGWRWTTSPFLGGYRLLLDRSGLGMGRGLGRDFACRPPERPRPGVAARPVTLADRLRPLVNAAMAGTLRRGSKRSSSGSDWLLAQAARAGTARPARVHAAAPRSRRGRPALLRLEDWLHRPAGTAEPVDVAALLEPYQSIPADARRTMRPSIVVAVSSPRRRAEHEFCLSRRARLC